MPYLSESNIFVANFCVVSDNKTIWMHRTRAAVYFEQFISTIAVAANRKVKVSFTD